MRARTRSRMLALVRQWETSGETRRAFADRHGVTLSCFDCWRRQVREASMRPGTRFLSHASAGRALRLTSCRLCWDRPRG